MDDHIIRLITNLQQAKTMQEIKEAIDELVQIGEPAVPSLLDTLKTIPVSMAKGVRIFEVLRKIGYPGNKLALPEIVSELSIPNSPSWDIAFAMAKEIGGPTIPFISKTLQYYLQEGNDDWTSVEGLCILLTALGSPIIDPLTAELLEILNREDNTDYSVIKPIRKIGSPKVNAAIPILKKKILDRTRKNVRRASIDALIDFDPFVVRPLTPLLMECLLDDSETIRNSTRKILQALGETT